MEEKILTPDQVAQTLQIHPFTVLKFIKQGKLKASKLGRVYRIRSTDVERFLDEQAEAKRTPKRSNSSEVPKSDTSFPPPKASEETFMTTQTESFTPTQFRQDGTDRQNTTSLPQQKSVEASTKPLLPEVPELELHQKTKKEKPAKSQKDLGEPDHYYILE